MIGPELLQVGAHLLQPLWSNLVKAARSGFPLRDEAGIAEHPEVLRDGRAGHLEVGGDLTDGELCVADQQEDFAPPRLGDGLYRAVHQGR